MPGIITHRKIFQDSIKLLSARKKKTYVLKSIETLFNSEEYLKAGFFGLLGPNVFDYIPVFSQKKIYGHPVSFQLHNGGCADFIPGMIKSLLQYPDKNNEWVAYQKAYIYGFISHYVADSFLHPFVFCWSGFPDNYTPAEIYYYRQQNLLFQYNIDNYYLYFDDKKEELQTSVLDYLPLETKKRRKVINSAVKVLILDTLRSVYPDAFEKLYFNKKGEKDILNSSGWFDTIPHMIKLVHWLKHTDNPKAIKAIEKLRKSSFMKSDFFVRYPEPRKTDKHVLNFHREKWLYPGETAGFRYDSVDLLCEKTVEKTVELWEMIEKEIYEQKQVDFSKEFRLNLYSGEEKTGYHDMSNKSPVKLGTWY